MMKRKLILPLMFFVASANANVSPTVQQSEQKNDDSYLWLEDTHGKEALDWVNQQNKSTFSDLKNTTIYKHSFTKNLELINSDDRLPYINERAGYLYNFWQDNTHKHGIYRRTTLSEYKKAQPQWETVFDVDKLSKSDGVTWVFRGANCLYPKYERCLISLSPGGSDAIEIREFDIPTKQFVENGFQISAAKSHISWRDMDSVFVTTDFGNDSMTYAGYPRIVKLWQRGTKLNSAKTLFETEKSSLGTSIARFNDKQQNIDIVQEAISYYSTNYYLLEGAKKSLLPIPKDATVTTYTNNQLFIRLKSDWAVNGQQFRQGSIIYVPIDSITSGNASYHLLIEPTDTLSITAVNTTKSTILVSVLDNVKSQIIRFKKMGAKWVSEPIDTDSTGTVTIASTNANSDDFYINYSSYLSPNSLYKFSAQTEALGLIKSEKDLFNSQGLETKQYWATSKDGTKVPYFVSMKKGLKLNGQNPTLMYGYGGFELSVTPYYSSIMGSNWLEKGGVFVAANIRGGGEFGPSWHKAALTTNRHKAFEDFEAIAEDLISRKITSPAHLGIEGQSNGGLLVAATLLRRPDLYKAVVSQSPLLDMKRYSKLLAGISWTAEYGNPEQPEMWDYLKTYSPFHNVDPQIAYPKILITASTNDDRVHPGHARRMVAKLQGLGNNVYYYENLKGGHADSTDNVQRAEAYALIYSYLWQQLL
ncbi:prolyl oligopeptidase family serine peptidase [Alteromonas sp. ASW11-130]|uniref:prolyl oligopeptidase family serine peptidase n=1 Tax=Alteromonas sp. ASW11-130 TaxID=3015775 RepID=UPI002242BC1E|nr:prolyl oligopeptidase family serine peptidase [Alteromonas sp. ASW11-130]MCW8090697.1 prolyl oligopeptidase family serine peptidase [Alteromonas sp. ASW11-130]